MRTPNRIGTLHGGGNIAALAMAAPLVLAASNAHAAVVISSKATQNMSCSAGICAPTAKGATLNAGDLQTMLASGNVSITTTGAGVQANDIAVKAALAWSTGSVLTFDAWRSLTIDKAVAVEGQAGLSILTNDGGSGGMLSFGRGGNVTFANLSSALSIDGTAYTLVSTVKSLASAIAGNPSGAYALASSFDASQDGTYPAAPVSTPFTGSFEGLGNAVANLSVNDGTTNAQVGLFSELDVGGTLQHIFIRDANVAGTSGTDASNAVGSLVGFDNGGTITGASSSGEAAAPEGSAGGVVGRFGFGTIQLSHSSSKVSGIWAGGLVGFGGGNIDQSYATGAVSPSEYGGGLVGFNVGGTISNSYATGKVKGPRNSAVGGFAGAADDLAQISDSYSTGEVHGGIGGDTGTRGGFVGTISFDVTFTDSYWDLDTSGIKHPWRGAGNIRSEPGITGLTTEQFQSGLPQGFGPNTWAEDPNVNGGLPYLLANPPS